MPVCALIDVHIRGIEVVDCYLEHGPIHVGIVRHFNRIVTALENCVVTLLKHDSTGLKGLGLCACHEALRGAAAYFIGHARPIAEV